MRNELNLSGGVGLIHTPPRRFRRRVFFYLLTLTLLTSVSSGGAFYSRQLKFIERDRARRARTLLTSLATQAELGAYAGDALLCDLPVRRTFNEEDVVLAGVYDARGQEILREALPTIASPPRPPFERLRPLLSNPDAEPVRVQADGYDDLWAPIVTTARPPAVAMSTEPGGRPARREVIGLARVGLSLQPAREQLVEVVLTGLVLTVGLLLLGAVAALLIARRISDPILALARGADEIRHGNLDVRIDVESEDEVGVLADSFNRMAARLRETMAELASLNRHLEEEVSRRTDEIRRSAEFTAVLNAPIVPLAADAGLERPSDARTSGHTELDRLLGDALTSLQIATAVRGVAVLLLDDEGPAQPFRLAASRGVVPKELDAASGSSLPRLGAGQPLAGEGQVLVPILFRGAPLGAVVLLDDPVGSHAVEFAARAAGPLAIAISNVRAFAKLEQLARELTERNSALVTQRDQLQVMNRLKSEFLANVSHELRTPLNAILGYTELVSEGLYGPVTDEQKEALSGVDESSKNLLQLINQILDLSKVESGKMEVHVSEVSVRDLVQAVATEAHALTLSRPYSVQVVCPSSLLLRTDSVKLQQILTNLVTNAIKFTEKGSVTIEARPQPGGGCTISVRDTGIGIRREDQRLIFEEFRQVDGSSTRRYQGTGLGLSIARRFALLLGGDLTVQSSLGVGSTFALKLPRDASVHAAQVGALERPRPEARPPVVPRSAK